ncbi:MAG: hypothetical protein BWK75_02060 [Candidatus Altiarchaeales archaeon A3]|nr:MAG: hypothetical protein BWK75_02060 [Candidatus Altiarchaeales archaeon A3]
MNQLNKCDLCRSTNLEFVDVVHDYNIGFKGNFNLYKCENCGLMFLNPQPSVEECPKYYTYDYYQKIDEYASIQKIVKISHFLCKKFMPKIQVFSRFFSRFLNMSEE